MQIVILGRWFELPLTVHIALLTDLDRCLKATLLQMFSHLSELLEILSPKSMTVPFSWFIIQENAKRT